MATKEQTKKVAMPLLLMINGVINLFPKTFDLYLNWGASPLTVRTFIGLISSLVAIYLLSEIRSPSKEEN